MASFDEYCIFANNMKLTRKQVGTLENLDPPGEHMKYYVYKMKRSSLTPKKCKMVRCYLLNHGQVPIFLFTYKYADCSNLSNLTGVWS
jgi:hypothetical protein